MALQQYHVLKATKAGDPWTSNYGSQMQTYFLDLEGVDRGVTVMCNRKVESPAPLGFIWAEAQSGTTKKGGPKLQLTIKPAPDNQTGFLATPQPAQQAQAVSVGKEGMSWGEAIIAAATYATFTKAAIDEVIKLAGTFYKSAPPAPVVPDMPAVPTPEPKQDIVVEDFDDDDPVNLDDIPF